jgi:Domain of unknown function (DUF4401)
MNPQHTADTLWSRLRAEGAVTSEAPAQRDDLPWYLAGLIGVSAWIAAALLFGFFLALFDRIWTTPVIATPIGTTCVVVSLGLLRIARGRDFPEQSAIALSLVGQLLVGVGLSEWFGDTAGWACSAAIALVLYVVGAQAMHRFLCGGVFAVAVVAICNELDTDPYGLTVFALPVLAWLTFVAWWRTQYEDGRTLPVSPLAWALSLVALFLAFVGDFRFGPDAETLALQRWVAQGAIALLLPLAAWRLSRGRSLPVLCAIVFALLWLRAPGVSLGVMLALIAFASHRPALLATALMATAVYLLRYYYQLEVPLLQKSHWLLLGGAALLAIRFVLARVARGERA